MAVEPSSAVPAAPSAGAPTGPPTTAQTGTPAQSQSRAKAARTPNDFNDVIDSHLQAVKDCILRDAAENSDKGTVDARAVLEAVDKFSRTVPLATGSTQSVGQQALLNVPGLVWISAILAIVFGYLAKDGNAPSQFSASMSDIAKVFAGAIVGASGATATAAIRRS
jgi:hypothetical protein